MERFKLKYLFNTLDSKQLIKIKDVENNNIIFNDVISKLWGKIFNIYEYKELIGKVLYDDLIIENLSIKDNILYIDCYLGNEFIENKID